MDKKEREIAYRIHIRHGEFELDIEGDRAFVESYLEALFLEEEAAAVRVSEPKAPKKAGKPVLPKTGKKRGRPRKAETRTKGAPAEKKERKRKYGAVEIDKKALAAFTAGKAAKSNKERYHLYLQFLKNAGHKEAADAHVQACFRAEGLPVPPTGRQHFRTLMGQGFVRPGSRRGLWALTDAGAAHDFGAAEVPGGKGGARRKARGKAGRKPARKAAPKPAGKAARKKPKKPAVKKAAQKAGKKAAKPAAPKAPKGRPGRKPKAAPVPEAQAPEQAASAGPAPEGGTEPSPSA